MNVKIRAEDAPRILANIARLLAAMKALGMEKHDVFTGQEGSIRWCNCRHCVKRRGQKL